MTPWVKHEVLGLDGKGAKPITMNTIFMKEKYVLKVVYSMGERVITTEGASPLQPQPSGGKG